MFELQATRAQVPDWVLTSFLGNCMQETNASQVIHPHRTMGQLSVASSEAHSASLATATSSKASCCRLRLATLQDAGRQSRQVKLLCACVAVLLQRQPSALAESLPELLSFCIQVCGGLCVGTSAGGSYCLQLL